ncbi:hypothetical protein [Sphingomonas sp. DBB INV C78]|uniref:hypothetical protein n=1 Tax=Sphingomonas sp. DBB INV C78 TaxID=3349434 RepID=UPI0036D2F3A7
MRLKACRHQPGSGVDFGETAQGRFVEDNTIVAPDHAQIGGSEIDSEFGSPPGKGRNHISPLSGAAAFVSRDRFCAVSTNQGQRENADRGQARGEYIASTRGHLAI